MPSKPLLHALIVVPPFFKSTSGPPLGPAMLLGAARRAQFSAQVLDLNADWINTRWPRSAAEPPSVFTGDHDKPGRILDGLQARFSTRQSEVLELDGAHGGRDPYMTLTASFDAVDDAAVALAASADGDWLRQQLASHPPPAVVGLSVMFSGQVVMALAISVIAKQLWPTALVIWGGAHMTALKQEIAANARYGTRIDGFVFGYAEQTFVDLVRAAVNGNPLPAEVVVAGSRCVRHAREDLQAVPEFDDLSLYGRPRLTLPFQTSRGCSYGRCTFCTHPAIEGAKTRELPLEAFDLVLRLAERHDAVVSFKDALLTPHRLEAIADRINGRARWSACTKLDRRLIPLLPKSAASGLDTLEFGLESAAPSTQKLIQKKQSRALLLDILDAAHPVKLVINYITGFPGEESDPMHRIEARQALLRARADLAERHGRLVAAVHESQFELERLSPLALRADAYGIQVVRAWPWATVLDWQMAGGGR